MDNLRLLAALIEVHGQPNEAGHKRLVITEHSLWNVQPGSEVRLVHDHYLMTYVLELHQPEDRRTIDGGTLLSIECPSCHRVSYHPKDVENRFCGQCGWHDQLPQLGGHIKALTHRS
jgi:hypothetical protein